MPHATPRLKVPTLPRWASAAGLALIGLVLIEGWMLYDWRRLAMQRESVGSAAEALCLNTLLIADQQSATINQLGEMAQKTMGDLQACHEVVVPRSDVTSTP